MHDIKRPRCKEGQSALYLRKRLWLAYTGCYAMVIYFSVLQDVKVLLFEKWVFFWEVLGVVF